MEITNIRDVATDVIGRKIQSSAQLTKQEAKRLIDHLTEISEFREPIEPQQAE